MLRELWQDSRYGVRTLLKQPGFTLIVVLTLALGIGANTAIFSLLDKLIMQSLPVRDPAALVFLQGTGLLNSAAFRSITFTEFSWADYSDFRAKNQVFGELTAFAQSPVNLGSGDQMERVRAELVSDNYFKMLGVRPSLGRDFLPEDNRTRGAHPLALISYSMWRSRFGGDPRAIGQTVQLNEASYTIIGVAPPGFKGLTIDSPVDVWVPAMMYSQIAQMPPEEDWVGEHGLWIFKLAGRLKPGIGREAAQASMDTLARQERDSWTPKSDNKPFFNEYKMELTPAGKGISSLRGEMQSTLDLLLTVVSLILLIACANVANLLLARSSSRRKEIAIRLALGARRGRLIRQLLTESLILAIAGGAAGMLLAPWLTGLLLVYQKSPQAAAAVLDNTINWQVAVFTLLVSSLTGLLFGLLPSLQASRPDLVPALKDEGALRADGAGFNISRRALIVAQVAMSVVVLICAGLFLRTLKNYLAIDPGLNVENVLVAELELPLSKYNKERIEDFYRRLLERLRVLPGVESVATANSSPLGGHVVLDKILIEGQAANPDQLPTAFEYTVSAGYHELMGIHMLAGRGFTEADRKGAPGVAIVNETLARRYFPGGALGKKVSLGVGEPWLEIVGVTKNIRALGVKWNKENLQIDLPVEQQSNSNPQRVLVRTRGDAAGLLPAVRREVRSFDPGLSFFKTTTLKDGLLTGIAGERMNAVLISLFGALALLLAAVGLYGVIAYSVSHRTREIGIRMALGAQPGDVLRLVMREGLLLIALGLSLGLASAWASTRLIKGFLYNVSPTDPLTFVAIALLLLLVTSLACWLPARNAMKVDPMSALRCD